mmetsp:Transcript_54579/g.132550  ORF Transcript_54579/g.132550 Transcript_54579/m.132550 type:complete len:324 (-) Transcript_54579:1166-2137(-)
MAEAEIDQDMFAAAAEEVFADAPEGGEDAAAVEDMIMMESKGSVAVNAAAAEEVFDDAPPAEEEAAAANIVAPSPTRPVKKRSKEDLPDLMGVGIAKRFKVDGEAQVFFGKVDKKLDDDDMSVDWHVTYEDGDQEDLTNDEVVKAKKFFERVKKQEEKDAAAKAKASRKSSRESKKTDTYITASSVAVLTVKKDKGTRASAKTAAKSKAKTPAAKKTTAAKAKAPAAKKGKATAAKPKKASAGNVLAYEGKPDIDLEGGWPKGWTMKKYTRASGATKGGTDRYFFTPEKKYKLRSMVQVKKFIDAMKKGETKGDEEKSLAAIK